MHVKKNKLPKGMSYPLKSSFIEEALRSANLEIDTTVLIQPSGIFFDASFWPPKGNISYERLYVRAGAVNAQYGKAAKSYMEDIIIPHMIEWLTEIISLDRNSPKRQADAYFRHDYPEMFK